MIIYVDSDGTEVCTLGRKEAPLGMQNNAVRGAYNLSRLLASKFSSIISLMPGLVGVGIMSRHHTELSSPTPLHAAPTARRFRINQQPLRST